MPKQPAALGQFPCNFCNKRFTRNADVDRHINNSHLGLKPFQCGYCEKAFSQKANLRRHFLSCGAAREAREAADNDTDAVLELETNPPSGSSPLTTWSLPSPIIDDAMPLFPPEAGLFATPAITPETALQPVASGSNAATATAPPRIRATRPGPYNKQQRPRIKRAPQVQISTDAQLDMTPDFDLLASLMSTPATFDAAAFDTTFGALQLDLSAAAPAPQPSWGDFATGNMPVPLQEPCLPVPPPPPQPLDLSLLLAPQAGPSAQPESGIWDPPADGFNQSIDAWCLEAFASSGDQDAQSIDLWSASF
ncbi:hypothetical protein AURDEDRAFT_154491 [Auricularia subglabra TFB-10046 SS5]|uniref:C2H2-type domain-containing protein n=1 Tax=Auricularia subglabra (strain TFB-10046 / SS5) TaxID=717982 RepID=J0DA27_AURST|nr:hypothetical protein AURDEDRAFT_154491 [Auricularia subglabra TFB-10046 SS5]